MMAYTSVYPYSTHLQENAWIVVVDQSIRVIVVQLIFSREGKVEAETTILYLKQNKQSYPLGSMSSCLFVLNNTILLKPALGGVRDVALVRISLEQTQ